MLNKQKLKENFSTCSGPSMYPILRNGDGIVVEAYQNKCNIKIGDIIVYPNPDKNKNFDVVHRVIKVLENGVVTRGDNNNKTDPYLVEFETIYGLVVLAKRKKRTITIINGKSGYYIHKLMLIRRFLAPVILRPMQKISAQIDTLGIFNFMHFLFKTEKVVIAKNGRKQILLSVNKKVIGRKFEGQDWVIRFPYKYFINKGKL